MARGWRHPDNGARGGNPLVGLARWLDRVDPGTHRRIKGLRLVTAYGIAALLGTLHDITHGLSGGAALSPLAAGFALWASVSEGRTVRWESSRDLALLAAAAALGAMVFIALAPLLASLGHAGPELVLASGAFLVGYLKRFGVLGAGIGSQIYIGQLLAYGSGLRVGDYGTVAAAGMVAAVAAIIPRLLSGPSEHPALAPAPEGSAGPLGGPSPALAMGLQAAVAAVVIVTINAVVGLQESAWAITACTYVVAGTAAGTIDRIRRRILGTVVGVPLGLLALPMAKASPILAWCAAAVAMVIYAMALPGRYDIACGAYAFTLIMTLAVAGEHSVPLLAARAWETLLGGALGLAAAMVIFPFWPRRRAGQ